MFTSNPRYARVFTAAVLAAGFIASAQARPSDPFWKPGVVAAAISTTSAPQHQLGAPFYGPRQTIPTRLSSDAPPQAALTNDAVRWIGPRSTVPFRK